MNRAVSLVIVAIVVAGCGSSTTSPSAPGPTPTTVLTTAPTATVTAAVTVAPTGTAAPTATIAPTGTPAATPTPAAAGTALCSYPTTIAGTAAPGSNAIITDVRAATHEADGYDRIVFEFAGATYPTLQIRTVAPPFAHDGSALPFTVKGTRFLELRLQPATRAGGYSGATTIDVTGGKLVQLVEGGDYEAIVHWVAGMTGDACVHAFPMSAPTRLVIDIARP